MMIKKTLLVNLVAFLLLGSVPIVDGSNKVRGVQQHKREKDEVLRALKGMGGGGGMMGGAGGGMGMGMGMGMNGGLGLQPEPQPDPLDDPDPSASSCSGGLVPFSFRASWTIIGDRYNLFETGGTGDYSDRKVVLTFGPYSEDRFEWTSEESCIDPNECYIFLATDGHEGQPFGYPPSYVTYNGETFLCTGDSGPGGGGDIDTCDFGARCACGTSLECCSNADCDTQGHICQGNRCAPPPPEL